MANLYEKKDNKSIPIAGSVVVDNLETESSSVSLSARQGKVLNDKIEEMKSDFQDGVDSIYNAVVSKGSTPSSKSLGDVVTGISNIPNSNAATYTFASGSTGATVDMGVNNTYRYANAQNVYNAGLAAASPDGYAFTKVQEGVTSNPTSIAVQNYATIKKNDYLLFVASGCTLGWGVPSPSCSSIGISNCDSKFSTSFNSSAVYVDDGYLNGVTASNIGAWIGKVTSPDVLQTQGSYSYGGGGYDVYQLLPRKDSPLAKALDKGNTFTQIYSGTNPSGASVTVNVGDIVMCITTINIQSLNAYGYTFVSNAKLDSTKIILNTSRHIVGNLAYSGTYNHSAATVYWICIGEATSTTVKVTGSINTGAVAVGNSSVASKIFKISQ